MKHPGIHVLRAIPLILITFLIISISGILPAYAASNVYYVAKNGSNSNPGTESQPWLTIQNAVNKVAAGDTIYVESGTYNETVSIISKPSSITIQAYPGNSPIIDGSGLSTGETGLVTIRNTNYLTINGFEIRSTTASSGGYGVYAYESIDHLTLKNLTVHNINKGGCILPGCITTARVSIVPVRSPTC